MSTHSMSKTTETSILFFKTLFLKSSPSVVKVVNFAKCWKHRTSTYLSFAFLLRTRHAWKIVFWCGQGRVEPWCSAYILAHPLLLMLLILLVLCLIKAKVCYIRKKEALKYLKPFFLWYNDGNHFQINQWAIVLPRQKN